MHLARPIEFLGFSQGTIGNQRQKGRNYFRKDLFRVNDFHPNFYQNTKTNRANHNQKDLNYLLPKIDKNMMININVDGDANKIRK